MGAIVTFDYDRWAARFPEFNTVEAPTAQAYFDEATMFWRNDGSGPVADPNRQLMLLNLLTAHIAKLAMNMSSGQGGLVGPITSASEGSVSVSTTLGGMPWTAAWFAQTPYGFEFWNATKSMRSARYRARPTFIPSGGAFPGGPWR